MRFGARFQILINSNIKTCPSVNPSWKGHDRLDCAGNENMRLTVTITEVELQQAEPGRYHDTVTLTVAAQ